MSEDQHRGFARYTGNLAEDEFIGHHIAGHGHRDFGKRLNDPPQAFGLFGMLVHRAKGIFSCAALRSFTTRRRVSTALGASDSFILTWTTAKGCSAER